MKSLALMGVVGIVGLEALYWLLDTWPEWWWLLMAALLWLCVVALTWLAPVALIPLFYRITPLDDPELVGRLTRLAEQAGARVEGVYVMDMSSRTTAANAMLTGLGRTRRIILGDTLLEGYSHDEIETVLAHELAHHVHNDLPKGLAAQAALMLAGMWLASVVLEWGVEPFGLEGIEDIAGFPLIALTLGLFGAVSGPFVKAYSRHAEAEADRYAVRTTTNAGAFVSMMTKLTDQNLGEAEPAWWAKVLFYDHPTYGERIAIARAAGGAG